MTCAIPITVVTHVVLHVLHICHSRDFKPPEPIQSRKWQAAVIGDAVFMNETVSLNVVTAVARPTGCSEGKIVQNAGYKEMQPPEKT
jgi:hypothetical protein